MSTTSTPTRIISFSGIDGAGKSTQIDALGARLREMGLRVLLITFWEDVAMLTHFRESAGKTLFKGETGVGSPSAPVERRDKNVRSPLMTGLRFLIYLLDTFSVGKQVRRALRSDADVVIFDRYLYDELANLTLENPLVRSYVRLLLAFTPKPQIAFLLDADPVAARARKPEYPVDFLHLNRQAYLTLSQWVGPMAVIAPMSTHEVEQEILERTLPILPYSVRQTSRNRPSQDISNQDQSATLDGAHANRVSS